MKYNRNNIQEHLIKNIKLTNLNAHDIGYILNLVDGVNSGKRKLSEYTFGNTTLSIGRMFEAYGIKPEPAGSVEVAHIPHQHIVKIFICCDDIIVATENPLTGDVNAYKTKETTIDHLGIHGIFEFIQ